MGWIIFGTLRNFVTLRKFKYEEFCSEGHFCHDHPLLVYVLLYTYSITCFIVHETGILFLQSAVEGIIRSVGDTIIIIDDIHAVGIA